MSLNRLVFDIGNTRVKLGIFEAGNLMIVHIFDHSVMKTGAEQDRLKWLFSEISQPFSGIISSVINLDGMWLDWLNTFGSFFQLEHTTAIPFINAYESRQSLGTDRIAVVAGARALNDHSPSLIINAGTAITYDFIDQDGIYYGGAISPGLQMRYQSLHTLTARLPLIELDADASLELIGTDTEKAIRSGVQLNSIYEIKGVAEAYKTKYPNIQVYLSGGDSKFFVTHLKSSIFAVQTEWQPDLVLIGLNTILIFNDV